MVSQVRMVLVFVCILAVIKSNLAQTLAQTNCAKIDFNRTTFPEFGVCQGKNQPNFVIKSYSGQKELAPYRQKSVYYLSNNFHDSYSCAESTIPLTVNPTSLIEAAVNLKSVGSSFLEIVVYDADRNERVDSLRTDGTNGWQIIHKNLGRTIQNARVRFILHLNILYSG